MAAERVLADAAEDGVLEEARAALVARLLVRLVAVERRDELVIARGLDGLAVAVRRAADVERDAGRDERVVALVGPARGLLVVVAADLDARQRGVEERRTDRQVDAEREQGVVALVRRARGVVDRLERLLDALVRRARVGLVAVAVVLDAAADVAVVVVQVGALARRLLVVIAAELDLRASQPMSRGGADARSPGRRG